MRTFLRGQGQPALPPWGRTSAFAECRHSSGRAVRRSTCAILLRLTRPRLVLAAAYITGLPKADDVAELVQHLLSGERFRRLSTLSVARCNVSFAPKRPHYCVREGLFSEFCSCYGSQHPNDRPRV